MPYLIEPEELWRLTEGEPSYRASQLRDWLYRTPVLDPEHMTNLPSTVREIIGVSHFPFTVEAERVADDGRTRKWLFRAPDGAAIEAVLMGYPDRATLCVSSQAGCALACTFCATGQFGFQRHLEAGEIVAQVGFARAFLRQVGMPNAPDRLTNLVFMGMGEPLANYRRVREALRRIIEVGGMSARAITVSTVGVVPGMLALAEEPWQVSLAVSLHAADDDLRSRLVPLNRRYPLAEVERAAANFYEKKRRRISIEWTMMAGVNDGSDQADKLASIALRLKAHVNLIPLNPTPLSVEQASPPAAIRAFVERLTERGVTVTVRDTRGKDIAAACGQLAGAH